MPKKLLKKLHKKEEKLHHKAEKAMKSDEKVHKKIERAEKKEDKKKDPKKKHVASKYENKKGKVEKVMKEFKEDKLHSGSKKGPLVSNKKQAIAIALSEARRAGAKIPKKKSK